MYDVASAGAVIYTRYLRWNAPAMHSAPVLARTFELVATSDASAAVDTPNSGALTILLSVCACECAPRPQRSGPMRLARPFCRDDLMCTQALPRLSLTPPCHASRATFRCVQFPTHTIRRTCQTLYSLHVSLVLISVLPEAALDLGSAATI